MAHVRTLTPADEMRLFAGLAIQPFLAGILALIAARFVLDDVENAVEGPWEVSLGIAVYVAVGAAVITALCVFPTVVWWVTRRRVTLWTALAFGLVFANLPVIVSVIATGGARDLIRAHAFVSFIGAAGAIAFWLISVRGRNFSSNPKPADEVGLQM